MRHLIMNSTRPECSKNTLIRSPQSASASSFAGISRPSALAVFRLIVRSNLVGCKTGNSTGLVPLRTLPV
jgi:hypothetical protein